MAVKMKTWVIVVLLITPWFWPLSLPRNLFEVHLENDIKEAHTKTEWERGKLPNSPVNTVFLNWPEIFVNQRVSVVVENIDIGNYFFSGHPRERVGIEEKQKFFFFQFILLLVGLTNPRLKKYMRFLVIFSLVALAAVFIFKWRSFEQTLPLSVPFIVVIALGLERISRWPKKWLIPFCSLATLEMISFLVFYSRGIFK